MTDRRRLALCYVALAALTFAVYSSVGGHAFVEWDDPSYVSTNRPVVGGLTWEGVRWAFTTLWMGNWHPLTWLSHMLDVSLFRMDAGWMHLVNLAFHVANTLLLFDLLRRMTGAVGRSAFVAALFAVHPLHVESVAWISERKDVLSTFFGFLAVEAYVAHVRRPRRLVYAAMLVAFTASLLAKPMLVTLPFALLLLDWWPLRRLDSRRAIWPLVREKLPLFALAAAAVAVGIAAQRSAGAVGASEGFPLEHRVANALTSYMSYVAKTVWPADLSAFYPWTRDISARQVIGAAFNLGVVSIAAVLAARRCPYLLVGWLWFLGTLTPVIGWVQVGSQSMADRYAYVPSVGLFVIVAWGAADLLAAWSKRDAALRFVGVAVVLAYAVAARNQVAVWKDSDSLWRHALEVDPRNHVAHNNLGLDLGARGRHAEAVEHFREALRVEPGYADAHNNLGRELWTDDKVDEAMFHFAEAARIRPDCAEAFNNLGVALGQRGRAAEAIADLEQALRLKPDYAAAHDNLGVALDQVGRTSEALAHVAEAVRLAPEVSQNHCDLGLLLAKTGNGAAAAQELETALRLDPSNAAARQALSQARRR